MAGCDADTGGTIGDYAYLTDYSKYSVYDGASGFKNQLDKARDNSSGGYTNINTSVAFNSSHDVDLYMEGADIGVKDMYSVAIFMPLNAYNIKLGFSTQIECSVKMHIKFIEITDDTHAWNMTSYDATARAEDQLVNNIITFYNSTSIQTIEFSEAEIAGKEGYFVVLWSSAEEIHSGNNGASDYGFKIDYDMSITDTNADLWLNKSRTYETSPENIADPYKVPDITLSTIYEACTVAGTRCDQLCAPSGEQWRYPCSIENLVTTDVQETEFTFTYYHDDRFSEAWGGSNKAYFTITKVSDGTFIDEQNLHVNISSIGVEQYQVIVDGRVPNEEYKIEVYYKNSGGLAPYETRESIFVTTEVSTGVIDAPTLYFWSQDKATPDVIKTYFAQIDGADSYDLIVTDPGNNIVFNQNYVDTGNIGEIITISVSGLIFNNLYHFKLVANPDGAHTPGTDYEIDVLKTGWLAKTIITLAPMDTSIVVNYTVVPNANSYTIKLKRDGYNQIIEYTGAYNSPYTITDLIFNKDYTITIDAYDTNGVYQYSTEYDQTTTLNPITYLDIPQVKYTNTGSISANSDNVIFELRELITNAERYEIIINGVAISWDPTIPYNLIMDYGTEYTITVKAYNDTYSIESESRETKITLYKKLTTIEPANYIKYAHGSNLNTNEINVYIGFDAGRGGETLITTIEDLNGNIVSTRSTVVANNIVDNDSFNYITNGADEYIIRSWFEIPKTWGGSYEAKSIEKVCRIRTLADTDNDGHTDNHPTNPDRDNPNTTFGYGDGLGL